MQYINNKDVQCSVNDLNGVTQKDQIKHELRK